METETEAYFQLAVAICQASCTGGGPGGPEQVGLGPPVLSAPGPLGRDGWDGPARPPARALAQECRGGSTRRPGPGTCVGIPTVGSPQPHMSRGLLPPGSSRTVPAGALRSAQSQETKRASGPSRALALHCSCLEFPEPHPGLAVPGHCSSYHSLTTSRTMPFCPARHLKRNSRLPRGKWWPGSSRLREHQPRIIKPPRASGFWWLQAASEK